DYAQPAPNVGAPNVSYGAPTPAAPANPFASPQFGGTMAAAPDSVGRTGPPWERDGQTPNSYIETVKQVLLDPMTTFATMRREGGLGKPLMYAIVGGEIGGIVGALYNLVLPNPF